MATTYDMALKIGGEVAGSFNKSIDSVNSKIDGISKTVGNVIKVASGLFALDKVVDFGTSTIGSAMEYEDVMSDVVKVVDGLRDEQGNLTPEYESMHKEILYMSKDIPLVPEELAQITAAAGQAGIAMEELTGFTEDAAKMATAFDVEASQSGEWLAGWRNSFHMTQEEVVALSDKLNYLGNTTTQEAGSLAEIVSRIGSLGEVAGIAPDKIAAMAGALTNIAPETAATGLKNFTLALSKGDAATKNQAESFKKLGFNTSKLAQRMQEDAEGAIIDVLSSIKKLDAADQTAIMTQIFGSESVAAVAQMVNNIEGVTENFEKMGDESRYAGSMQDEFNAKAATTSNKMQLAKNRLGIIQKQLGSKFLPIVADIADGFSEIMDSIDFELIFDKIDLSGIKTFLDEVDFGNLFSNIDTMGFQSMLDDIDFGNIRGNLIDIKDEFSGMLQDMLPKGEKFANSFVQSFAKIGPSITRYLDIVTDAWADTMPTISDAVNWIATNVVPVLSEAFDWIATSVIPSLVDAFEKIYPRIVGVWEAVWGFLEPVLNEIANVFNFTFPFIQGLVIDVIGIIGNTISNLLLILQGIIEFMTGVFTGDWEMAWTGIQNIFTGIVEGITDIVKGVLNRTIGIINTFFESIGTITVPDWVPVIGGTTISLPQIPQFADGTNYAPGGLSLVGEEGPELINLNHGDTVTPWDKTKGILKNLLNPSIDLSGLRQSAGGSAVPHMDVKFEIIIQGNATKGDVEKGVEIGIQKFDAYMKRWMKKNKRVKFDK